MTVYIYGLLCPLSGDIRYIGKSINPKSRLRAHVNAALNKAYDHHTSRWIRHLAKLNHHPELVILDVVADGEDWRNVEREWIASAITSGWRITNTTAGGEGLDYIDQDARAKYRANHRKAMERHWYSEAGKVQMEKMRSRLTPDVIAARSEAVSRSLKSEQYREKMRPINSEINSRPEVKAKKSSKSKAMWEDKRGKLLSAFASEECKRKQSESKKAAWADPVVGAKLREIHASEEVRRKKSEAAKRRATPEYRAMMAEKRRAAWQRHREQQGA